METTENEIQPKFLENGNIKSISGIEKLGLVIKYEWFKHFRKNRLYITLGLSMGFFLILNILLPYLLAPSFEFLTFPPDTALEFIATGSTAAPGFIAIGSSAALGTFFWYILIFIALFLGSDSISTEYENRTGLLLFPNPIKQETIVIGKYIASLAMASLVITIYYLMTWIFVDIFYGIYTAGAILTGFLWSYGITILIIAGMIATTFLLSAAINRALITGLVVFFLFIIIMPLLSSILMIDNIETWYLISYISNLITEIMYYPSNRFSETIIGSPERQMTIYSITPDVMISIFTVLVIYILIPLVITIIIAKRREI
ncbi:MAG: hypothetical protein EAX96_00210 [Candidatus Lokiarchaeota archaeon]|nr:hypothetical protein [Candidatus Lokiarchaeota archaeon]